MFNLVQLDKDQDLLISRLSHFSKPSRKELVHLFIELGISALIASKKTAPDGREGLEVAVESLKKAIDKDPDLQKVADLLSEKGVETKTETKNNGQ